MALSTKFSIKDEFPPVDYDQWRALVEADLKGAPFEKKLVTHTYEGIDVQPLYTRQDVPSQGDPLGFPGLPPFVRGSHPLGFTSTGVDLRQEHTHPDQVAANRAILADLAGGVTSLLLKFDAAARNGYDPDNREAAELVGQDGILAYCRSDLDLILAGVKLDIIGVTIEAGAAFLPAAALLVALWQQREISLEKAQGAFNADPLATLARDGRLPTSPDAALAMLADLARWTTKFCPGVTAAGVDTSPYHHAGATAAQDLAFAMATGSEYLRAMTAAGLDVSSAARQMLFRISLGTHHFLAIAKLRAARWLWWRVVKECGGSDAAAAMRIHARTSDRVLTHRDPYVNILRNTVSVFAAVVGGADAITSVPLDHVAGLPDERSSRVARNTLLILQEEGHLHRAADPGGGSWFLDTITRQIAEEAWRIFQEVERQGGMQAVLESGWVNQQIDAAYAPRAKDIARRKEGLTGVSEFPNLVEERVEVTPPDLSALREAAVLDLRGARPAEDLSLLAGDPDKTAVAVAAASENATIGQLARGLRFHDSPAEIQAVEARSFAKPFEELRDATDAWEVANGRRPRVFLANMGPIAHHTARANYAKNFFEVGGFGVVTNDGFRDADAAIDAFAKSGASIAVICSSDQVYSEMVPTVAPKLKAAGARSVVLAGNPGNNESAWRGVGVDRFIFIKCDVLATLRELLLEEGVLPS